MPLEVQHLRRDVKFTKNPRYYPVEHEWTSDLLDQLSMAVEEDGGASIVGAIYARGAAFVRHEFTRDVELPGLKIRTGDVVEAVRRRRRDAR